MTTGADLIAPAVKLLAEVLSVAHGKGPMWQHEMQATALLARLRPLMVPEWQTIETAPKDGTHVIGWFPEFGKAGKARQTAPSYAENVYWNGVEWSWVQDGDTPIHQPTHWMPLPAPPSEGGEG